MPHIFKRYDKELAELHRLVQDMGQLACRQLAEAADSLKTQDTAQARKIIHRDEEINQMDIRANDMIILLIARRQPVAKDLRDLMAIDKIIVDIERAGDEARKIARMTLIFNENSSSSFPNHKLLHDIFTLAAFAGKMLAISLEALDLFDLNKAFEVLRMAAELEAELKSTYRKLSTFIMEDSRSVGHFVEIVLGIRALERFGNHGKNIAGHLIFLIHGKDVRHENIEKIIEEISSHPAA